MANYAIWNVRKRHESLAAPPKKEKMSLRGRKRVGLQAALDRKAGKTAPAAAEKG